mgnify:FL=1
MKIFKNKLSIQKEIYGLKNLSFVPTMGGLHEGHKYLIKKAKAKKGRVAVSIYVNPKQFDSNADFAAYPRYLKNDLNFLEKMNVDYVFLPDNNDVYSFRTKKKIFLDHFSNKLCGKFRKNHFKGVLNVVNRFLEILKPKYIFLGEKDFQQLYLIKKHIKKNKIKTKVVSCKTIREQNGVACSTRNKNLNKKELKIASNIFKFLRKEKIKIKTKKTFNKKVNGISKKIKLMGVSQIQYLKVIDVNKLNKKKVKYKNFKFFIAYYLNRTRLIDNV